MKDNPEGEALRWLSQAEEELRDARDLMNSG
jgi:hypothetical protein